MDETEVRIGANTAPAKDSMDSAASSIAGSLQQMSTALEKFTAKNEELIEKVLKNNVTLSRSFFELRGSMTGGFNAITGVIERFRGVIGTLAAALAGGMLFKESVGALLELEDTVRGLSIVFGTSAEEATKQAIALKLAGVSAQTYEQMAMRVGMRVRTNTEEFERYGIKVTDAQGHLLPMQQILQNVYKGLLEFKSGADQDIVALATVGRGARDFMSDMERLNAATDRAADIQKRLGIEMGPERIAQVERYRQDLHEFQIVLETIGEKIAEEVLPNLQGMADWLNATGPSAIKVMVDAVKIFLAAMTMVGAIAERVGDKIGASFASAAVRIEMVAKLSQVSVMDAAHGFVESSRIIAEADAKLAIIGKASAEDMEMTWRKTWDAIDKLFSKAPGTGGGYDPRLDPGHPGTKHADVGKQGGDDKVAVWKQQLEQMQMAEGYFNEFSKADEAAFWSAKLALVTKGSKDYNAVYRLMYEALKADAHEEYADSMALYAEMIAGASNNKDKQLAIAHDRTQFVLDTFKTEGKEFQAALKDENKLREEWAKKDEALVKDAEKFHLDLLKQEAELSKVYLDGEVAAGRMSAQQRLEAEKAIEDQIYSAQLAEVDKYISTLQVGTLAYQQAMEKRLGLTIAYQTKELQLAQQTEKEREQYALQADQAITNSLGTLLDNLVNRTKTLKQTWQEFVTSLTQSLNKIASDQVMKQLMGPGTQGGNFLSGITSKIFGSGGTAQAATEQANTTAVGALTLAIQANTIALQSSGASGAGGGLGQVFSDNGGSAFDMSALPGFAEGTSYVPQTSLALVHKGEAIIPARYNDRSGMSMTNHTHVYVNGSPDTRTLHQIQKAAAQGVRHAQIRANGS
jgi:hypothetical protein